MEYNAKNMSNNMPKYRIIFSVRVKRALRELGFEPEWEDNNHNKPGFKCWSYLNTDAFQEALNKILGGN